MSPMAILLVTAGLAIAIALVLREGRLGIGASAISGVALGAVMIALGMLAADAHPLARVALIGTGIVSITAFGGSHGYYSHKVLHGEYSERDAGLIGPASLGFVTLLGAAALAENIVVAWMLIEATTILGVYLIAVGRHAHSVEAAWKFAVLCFTGVGFGLAGIGVLDAASRAAGAGSPGTFAALAEVAPQLSPLAAALGLGLVFVGFGTKAGIFPFHWWLPDAHSQTPTPVSALMSGALVPTALVLLSRMLIAMPNAAATLRPVLLAAGVLGLVLATLSIAYQRDAKRLLAYSTIEHMALMTLALAIGTPLALAAFAVHLLGHAIAKSAGFMGVGGLVEAAGSREIDRIAGSFSRTPLCSMLVLASGASLGGFPVGPIFVSEVLLLVAAVQAGMWWLALVVGLLLVIVAAAFAERLLKMLMGVGRTGGPTPDKRLSAVPMAVVVAGSVLLAWRPGVLLDLIAATAALAGGGS